MFKYVNTKMRENSKLSLAKFYKDLLKFVYLICVFVCLLCERTCTKCLDISHGSK